MQHTCKHDAVSSTTGIITPTIMPLTRDDHLRHLKRRTEPHRALLHSMHPAIRLNFHDANGERSRVSAVRISTVTNNRRQVIRVSRCPTSAPLLRPREPRSKSEANQFGACWRAATLGTGVCLCFLPRTYGYAANSVGRWTRSVVFPRWLRRERMYALL